LLHLPADPTSLALRILPTPKKREKTEHPGAIRECDRTMMRIRQAIPSLSMMEALLFL